MKRKRFMGPQGTLVVYLLHLEAVSERRLFWQFIGELPNLTLPNYGRVSSPGGVGEARALLPAREERDG